MTQPSRQSTENGLIGRVLAGRYTIRDVVAEGGMATVYRATRVIAQDEVAVKVMLPQYTRDRGFAARFRREAQIAWKLDHPSIVRVIDHGAEHDLYFMVMDLLDGEDLFDVLKRERRLAPDVARRILVDICGALSAAHAQGIVHRDLKPENVFMTRSSSRVEVKVLDFGVAKLLLPDATNESEPVLTAMGSLLGTPEYISPEMCRGEEVGPGADLYACGALLYALLTGRPPFVTERPLDVTVKHITEIPRPPSELVPGLSPALDAIVLKALAKQPAQRQESAAALADALRALGPLPAIPEGLVRASLRREGGSEAATLVLPPPDPDPTIPLQPAPPRPVPAAGNPYAPPAPAKPPFATAGLPRLYEAQTPPPSGPYAMHAVRGPQAAPAAAPAPQQAPVAAAAPAAVPGWNAAPAQPVAARLDRAALPPEKIGRSLVPPAPAAAPAPGVGRIAIAIVVLLLTFAAGVAVGRYMLPSVTPSGASH